ncbi:carnitine O-palmitoyltransferase 1, liver isoform-like isoform X1 [Pomacea canaliculata]|uniref:carnitine O-palmitoyltransferase 1, liver isoform-like isoform X1 n=2 Tax=Pomacea canaliculata TaxID=400727 RepID=UPI000D735E78|nr:carnitine O-palmitoyltransferase 1, liver isoform-like isoform X1 [Pomacea canaliculata]XP_025099484.1 carnitine O-palmitoyltransferase 1, liver isoform-like isoform X1 [Pomacea canaliculata]XP_025099485.1 carnitine O-palmitoyltransferase 1, liver isoform-like isoform X1 [Pomacea canaliculata]
MAEAHSAVAFSFTVTPEGVDVKLNHEALHAVWESGVLSWKKRIGKWKNNFRNGVFPASPISWLFTVTLMLGLKLAGWDPSCGLIGLLHMHTPVINSYSFSVGQYLSTLLHGTLLWILIIIIIKYFLRLLLTYHGWMYELHGRFSIKTKLWVMMIRMFGGRKPMLNSYQASLPKLPVPALKDTLKRYLESVRPLMGDQQYARMEKLAKEFGNGLGKKLQRYLVLKSWWATNYVTDWWEEYVYLHGRSPIMINSNFYGIDAVLVKPTNQQASRAANIICIMLKCRREVDREELKPILLNKTVPLCSAQYERLFNTTRIPGIETDTIMHLKDSNHIAVYHKGRYFKMYIRHKRRILKPVEIETMIQRILDDDSPPAPGEEHLAALTAVERVPWAKARKEYFSKGKNKASLDAIEKAAFVLSLDTEEQDYCPDDPTALDRYGQAMLHGKGYDRWFDKSFTLVVCPNGRVGFNAEHSWADAPIMAHLWEYAITDEVFTLGEIYRHDGRCNGVLEGPPPNPIRLEWEFPKPCLDLIESSRFFAEKLCEDVDLHIMMFREYGKGFIKTCKVSPDAYIQLVLQLAYYRSAGKFCLTYESSMTRLFREGRTETVRSCTKDTCAFVKAMEAKADKQELIRLLKAAANTHQDLYRDAMTGKGIDRHLFCLYVTSKYVGEDSPFLAEVLSEPWRLSTSQTPHQQTDKLDLHKYPDRICAGGGFGPVADDGYGVSYIIAGEDTIFFHISCKKSCPSTDSHRFGSLIKQAFADLRGIFEKN